MIELPLAVGDLLIPVAVVDGQSLGHGLRSSSSLPLHFNVTGFGERDMSRGLECACAWAPGLALFHSGNLP